MRSLNNTTILTTSAFFLLLGVGFLTSFPAKAKECLGGAGAPDCGVPVTFEGTYVDETCVVSINGGGDTETVKLPVVSTRSLNSDASEGGKRPFNIALKECPPKRYVTLTFKSNLSKADSLTGNLINTTGTGYSKNVQIRLRKPDGSQIKIDDLNSGQVYRIPLSGDTVEHTFSASYYAKGNNAVTVGTVHAAAGIELVYQ